MDGPPFFRMTDVLSATVVSLNATTEDNVYSVLLFNILFVSLSFHSEEDNMGLYRFTGIRLSEQNNLD